MQMLGIMPTNGRFLARSIHFFVIVSYSFQVIIILFGTIGNILTIFVLWGEKKKTGTAFLLVALAFADTSVLVSVSLILSRQRLIEDIS